MGKSPNAKVVLGKTPKEDKLPMKMKGGQKPSMLAKYAKKAGK